MKHEFTVLVTELYKTKESASPMPAFRMSGIILEEHGRRFETEISGQLFDDLWFKDNCDQVKVRVTIETIE